MFWIATQDSRAEKQRNRHGFLRGISPYSIGWEAAASITVTVTNVWLSRARQDERQESEVMQTAWKRKVAYGLSFEKHLWEPNGTQILTEQSLETLAWGKLVYSSLRQRA